MRVFIMCQNNCIQPNNKGETPYEQYCNPSTMQIVFMRHLPMLRVLF